MRFPARVYEHGAARPFAVGHESPVRVIAPRLSPASRASEDDRSFERGQQCTAGHTRDEASCSIMPAGYAPPGVKRSGHLYGTL